MEEIFGSLVIIGIVLLCFGGILSIGILCGLILASRESEEESHETIYIKERE